MAAPTDGRMKGQMVDMQEIGPFNVSEIRAFGVCIVMDLRDGPM